MVSFFPNGSIFANNPFPNKAINLLQEIWDDVTAGDYPDPSSPAHQQSLKSRSFVTEFVTE